MDTTQMPVSFPRSNLISISMFEFTKSRPTGYPKLRGSAGVVQWGTPVASSPTGLPTMRDFSRRVTPSYEGRPASPSGVPQVTRFWRNATRVCHHVRVTRVHALVIDFFKTWARIPPHASSSHTAFPPPSPFISSCTSCHSLVGHVAHIPAHVRT